MTVNSAVSSMAGFFIVASLVMAQLSHQIDITQLSWLWVVAFVGVNLFQMGITGFCPAKYVFRKLGLKEERNSSCCS